MHGKTIGILGASGRIGQKTLELLLEKKHIEQDYKLLVGVRQPEKMSDKVKENMACQIMRVDILNDIHLTEFCKSCDLVINTAGPSSALLDRVVQFCLKEKTHYVDPSGDYDVVRRIEKMQTQRQAHDLVFLMAAGCYPGLTELYPAYIAESYFNKTSDLSVYFSGLGILSQNAAWDIIESMKKKEGKAMVYWDQSGLKPLNAQAMKDIDHHDKVKNLVKFPVISPHFEGLCDQLKVEKAYFHNTFTSQAQFSKFIAVASSNISNKKEEAKEAINDLIKIYKVQPSQEKSNCTVTATGQFEGEKRSLQGEFLYEGNWNDLTATLLSISAQFIIANRVKQKSGLYMEEIFEPLSLINALKEYDLVVERVSLREKASGAS